MNWLRMIKDHIVNSFHVDTEDFNYTPFNHYGDLGKMYELFGDKMNGIIEELNEALVA